MRRLKDPKSSLKHLQVIHISHPCHVPSVSDEARGHILTQSQTCWAFNANAVVIVDPAEVGEFEMTSQRSGLTADTFHQASISAYRIDDVMKHLEARTIEVRSQ